MREGSTTAACIYVFTDHTILYLSEHAWWTVTIASTYIYLVCMYMWLLQTRIQNEASSVPTDYDRRPARRAASR
jgi:hypothetical protein